MVLLLGRDEELHRKPTTKTILKQDTQCVRTLWRSIVIAHLTGRSPTMSVYYLWWFRSNCPVSSGWDFREPRHFMQLSLHFDQQQWGWWDMQVALNQDSEISSILFHRIAKVGKKLNQGNFDTCQGYSKLTGCCLHFGCHCSHFMFHKKINQQQKY
jgi:hypothetical protein